MIKSDQESAALQQQVLAGTPPTRAQGLRILEASGARYSHYMAGAHALAERVHGNRVKLCSIINAKSGRCQENCAFCAQSSHHAAQTPVYPLKSSAEIVAGARQAAAEGAKCYGIVTSGASLDPKTEFGEVLDAIRQVRTEGAIEPSASLGFLTTEMARDLAAAGCVTYHHNLETAPSFFSRICTTHDYAEDLNTVRRAKAAGMKVCCGGIIGLGETLEQRVELAETLHQLDVDSIPINFLNPVAGTPLEGQSGLTPMDCLRTITLLRYFLPDKSISVCGGRETNLRDLQAMMFMAGANGTMVGNYLTTSGRDRAADLQMLADLEVSPDAC